MAYTLEQFISTYKPLDTDPPEVVQAKAQQLHDVWVCCEAAPYTILLDLFEQYTGTRYPSITQFESFVDALQLDRSIDMADFDKWVVACYKVHMHLPPDASGGGTGSGGGEVQINVETDCIQVSGQALFQFAVERYPFLRRATVRFADDTYLLPVSEEVVNRVSLAFPYYALEYVFERRDCDDFALLYKGWLSMQGYGNLAAGILFGTFVRPNGVKIEHAVNIIFYGTELANLNMKMYEPQVHGKFYSWGESGDFIDITPSFWYM